MKGEMCIYEQSIAEKKAMEIVREVDFASSF